VLHDIRAYIPFSAGVRVCPGKNIGMMELRTTVACIVQRFDMKPAVENLPGVKGSVAEWESTLEDNFTFSKGPLYVVLTDPV
jgi:Cytochrome P450